MPNPKTANRQDDFQTPNSKRVYEIKRSALPLRCPLPEMSLWNSHPAVFLPIEDTADGRILCPYCGTQYVLRDDGTAGSRAFLDGTFDDHIGITDQPSARIFT